MKKTFCILVVLIVAFAGCSTRLQVSRNSPTHVFQKTYDIGAVQQADVGTAMVTILSAYQLPTYRITIEYEPRKLPPITPDQKWIAHHTLGPNYILTTNKYPYQRFYGIEIKPSGELASKRPWIQVNNSTRPVQQLWKMGDSQIFVPIENHTLHDNYFKAEFIYAGIAGNTINITYREFSNYKSRPAFAQDLNYDLNASDDIVFRSLRIRVLEANNAIIRFRVVDDGALPWVPH